MNVLKSMLNSEIGQGLTSFSPLALIFFLVAFWEPLTTSIPSKNELSVIEGSVESIGNRKGSLTTRIGNAEINYECLCNHGWGKKTFKKGMPAYALGVKSGDTYKLWELTIGNIAVFKYEDIASQLAESKKDANHIAIPGIIVSTLLLMLLMFQKTVGNDEQRKQKRLFKLLDNLADQSKSDDERLSYLSETLSYEAWEIVESLESMAMNNTNSNKFLSRIGAELGAIWSGMEANELDAIVYIQPAAKASAICVLKQESEHLFMELEKHGAVNT